MSPNFYNKGVSLQNPNKLSDSVIAQMKRLGKHGKWVMRILENAAQSRDEVRFDELDIDEIKQMIDVFLEIWDSDEYKSGTPGHDLVHIYFDLLEFVHIAPSLQKNDIIPTLFGAIIHDLGRLHELKAVGTTGAMDFDNPSGIQIHAWYSLLHGLAVSNRYKKDEKTKDDIKQLVARAGRAALLHSGGNNTTDPAIHNVQTLDRLAGILGVREFVRNVITDCLVRGASLYPDERLDYSNAFPLFGNLPVEEFKNAETPKNSWTNLVHYIEMPMRNIFPLSTDLAIQRADAMRRESGIILILLAGGTESKLFKEIFAPEIERDASGKVGDYKFPKTPLPTHIWESVKVGINEEESGEMAKYDDYSFEELLDLMFAQQAPFITEAENEKAYEFFNSQDVSKHEPLKKTLKYVIARRKISDVTEQATLDGALKNPDPLISHIVRKLKQYHEYMV